MSGLSDDWSWQPSRKTRAAIRRGDKRFKRWQQELAAKAERERLEARMSRAGHNDAIPPLKAKS